MYTNLSKYYDLFMRSEDYGGWADYVCSFLSGKKCGVDLACGTGRFTIELLRRGYNVLGVDISGPMLNEAKQNAANAGIKAEFIQADMQKFQAAKKLDFMLAMCDAVNYLRDPMPFFRQSYNGLNDDGVLIFDISSQYKLINVLGNNTYSDTKDDITYIWTNSLSKSKDYIDFELTFFARCGQLYEKSAESQRQYIHSADKIQSCLIDAGYRDVKTYGNISMNKPQEFDERLHFVARK